MRASTLPRGKPLTATLTLRLAGHPRHCQDPTPPARCQTEPMMPSLWAPVRSAQMRGTTAAARRCRLPSAAAGLAPLPALQMHPPLLPHFPRLRHAFAHPPTHPPPQAPRARCAATTWRGAAPAWRCSTRSASPATKSAATRCAPPPSTSSRCAPAHPHATPPQPAAALHRGAAGCAAGAASLYPLPCPCLS